MTTSGSINYGPTASTIITEAYDMCGVGQEGEDITADMQTRALRSLELLVKAWMREGHLWTKTDGYIVLVADQASYSLSPRPLSILSLRLRTTAGATDIPMTEVSHEDYWDLPNKASSGTPCQFHYDPQLATGLLYVWPVPDATVAAAQTLRITYARAIEDFDEGTNTPDLPQEWMKALASNLADQLSIKYVSNPQRRLEIRERAVEDKMMASMWDAETTSVFVSPVMR